MAEKHSIYAGEPLATVLVGHEDVKSGRVNQVAADYLTMVRELTPTMTEEEWSATVDAINGMQIATPDETSVRYIWAEVQDFEGLGTKWGIDQEALAAKLRAMTMGQLLAVVEVNRRFWHNVDHPRDQALTLAGAKMAD